MLLQQLQNAAGDLQVLFKGLCKDDSQYSYLKCSKRASGHVGLINQESIWAVDCLWAVGDAINSLLM